jgi:hypothetical protein
VAGALPMPSQDVAEEPHVSLWGVCGRAFRQGFRGPLGWCVAQATPSADARALRDGAGCRNRPPRLHAPCRSRPAEVHPGPFASA